MKHLSTTIFIVTIFTVNRKSFLLQLLFNSVYHSFVIVKISRIYYILGVSSRMGSASFLFTSLPDIPGNPLSFRLRGILLLPEL